ncbi:hypothetical protein HRI_000925900 [Hibiscus trionum]|uniref:ENTH domain-containing protein n=1 Tax=Hibiscus trionum TaxID=183268 RepID=A0A9W7H946_HIBTR|nr:hypothetical protein HRI_000925900 [Hibiscus trionum]
MGSLVMQEFKKQASFFFREKIKTARLALTDVTPVQLLTEEATDGNMLSPSACKMAVISKAAFEVDDYWRIVEILHRRLSKFDTRNWRESYNALVLLDHLLAHGPLRVAEEFQRDQHSIKQMANFQFIDDKRFNWGLSVRKLSERILKLLENESFLKEERSRARKLRIGIKGFGRFNQISSSNDQSFNNNGRFGSQLYFHQKDEEEEDYFWEFKERFPSKKGIKNYSLTPWKVLEDNGEKEHPFCEDEKKDIAESLLS